MAIQYKSFVRNNHSANSARLFIGFVIGLFPLVCAVGASSASPLLIAESTAKDVGARKIRSAVTQDDFKPISTKESRTEDPGTGVTFESDTLLVQERRGPVAEEMIVESLEDSTPATITTEPAPGLRQPASGIETKPRELKTEAQPLSVPTSSGGPAAPASPKADLAQKFLENGNRRYVHQTFRKDGKLPADRARSSKVESPHAVVFSCSDSRVPPEILFDQGIGEISVVRTFGASLDSAVIASLEQTVLANSASLIVVLGHTSCSAIETAHSHDPNQLLASPAIEQAIADIRPRISGNRVPSSAPVAHSKNFEIEAATNVQAVSIELLKRSEILNSRVKAGSLKITPALYNIQTGLVNFY